MDKLREVIRNDPSLKIENITMNGGKISVDVVSSKDMTDEEMRDKQEELQRKMQKKC